MALPNHEKKLAIEIKHPEEELGELSDALKAISKSGASRQEMLLARRRIQEANAYSRLIRAYTRYMEFRADILEREIAQTTRS